MIKERRNEISILNVTSQQVGSVFSHPLQTGSYFQFIFHEDTRTGDVKMDSNPVCTKVDVKRKLPVCSTFVVLNEKKE